MGQEYLKKVQVTTQIAAPIEPLLFDDVEGLLKWAGSGDGAYTIEKSDARARGGDYSLHIKTRVAGAAPGDYAQASIALPVRQRRYLSFLAHCLLPVIYQDVIISLNFWALFSYLHHKGSLFYNNENGNIGYADKNEVPQWFPERATGFQDGGVGEMELIIDTALKEYVSLRINQTVIDMKGISYYTNATGSNISRLTVQIKIETLSAGAYEMYFDDILIRYLD